MSWAPTPARPCRPVHRTSATLALYTSFYTRQLALRPESLNPEHQNVEGEKTIQKAVPRRTIDVTGPYLAWQEKQRLFRNPADAPGMQAVPSAALGLLPPVAYAHLPATSFNVKFAAQAPSKTRSSVNVAAWTPDGRRCLTGTQAGEFCMWGGQSFQFETIIQAHETPVRAMTFTHSGNFLVSGDDSGSVRYWRTNLELVKTVAAHGESVRQVSFAPTDLKFATASDDSTVRVWDFARVAAEHVLAGHGGDVKTVAWHPSQALLASGSKDALVKLWCARSGRAVGTLQGHKGTVTATQWNANGNWVLTAARDQVAKVWDVRMRAELASFMGQGKDITAAAWHPQHEGAFVSGGHDGSLCFWLVGRGAPQAELRGAHEGSVWAAAWHPAGHLLATGAGDAATKFWCRSRPGDPFLEQQLREQAEMAAMEEGAAAPAPRAPAPALFAPPPSAAGGAAAIPGIGEGRAAAQVAAPVDIWASAAAPPDAYAGQDYGARRGGPAAAAAASGAEPPRRGGWRGEDAAGGDRRRGKRERSPLPRRRSPPRSRRGEPERDGWARRDRGPEAGYPGPPQHYQPPPQQPQHYPQYDMPPPPQQAYYSGPPPAVYAPYPGGGPPQGGGYLPPPQQQPYYPPSQQQPPYGGAPRR